MSAEKLRSGNPDTLEHQIQAEEPPRDFFFMMPNMVDDLGLAPHAFRLYCHLRRVAGERGECWQSSSTLASSCKIGASTVVSAKRDLVKAGLIAIERMRDRPGRPYHRIRIRDIWASNHAQYAAAQSSPQELQNSPQELQNSPQELEVRVEACKKNPTRIPPEEDKKRAATKRAARGRSLSEACLRYHDISGVYPNRVQAPEIDATVTDLELWARCVQDWLSRGWSPRNVQGMLEIYKQGGPRPGGRYKPTTSDAPAGYAALDEFERSLAQKGEVIDG